MVNFLQHVDMGKKNVGTGTYRIAENCSSGLENTLKLGLNILLIICLFCDMKMCMKICC